MPCWRLSAAELVASVVAVGFAEGLAPRVTAEVYAYWQADLSAVALRVVLLADRFPVSWRTAPACALQRVPSSEGATSRTADYSAWIAVRALAWLVPVEIRLT